MNIDWDIALRANALARRVAKSQLYLDLKGRIREQALAEDIAELAQRARETKSVGVRGLYPHVIFPDPPEGE